MGMPKTGSSAIQVMLRLNRLVLEAQGFRYNRSFGDRVHPLLRPRILHELTDAAARERYGHLLVKHPGFDAESAAKLDADLESEISTHSPKTMVLSFEGLWELTTTDAGAATMIDYFRARFDRVRYVVYLRRQDRHATSAYGQRVQNGKVEHFENVLVEDEGIEKYRYHTNLERLAARVGRSSIMVRCFEREQLQGGDAGRDFVHALGLELVGLRFPQSVVNPSWDNASIALALQLSRHMPLTENGRPSPSYVVLWKALAALDQNGSMPRVSRQRAQAYVDQFATENAAVARDYLDRDDGVLFREPIDGPDEDIPPSIEVDRCAEIMAVVLQNAAKDEAGPRDARIAFLEGHIEKLRARIETLRSALDHARGDTV